MKLTFILVPFLAIAGYWFFHVSNPEKVGFYRAEDQTELSLLPDKKLVLKEPNAENPIAGTYQISDGFLYLYLGLKDIRRLRVQGEELVYDPDAGMPQPTPVPTQTIVPGRLTPEEEAELKSLNAKYGPILQPTPGPTPRPKQTFRRVNTAA